MDEGPRRQRAGLRGGADHALHAGRAGGPDSARPPSTPTGPSRFSHCNRSPKVASASSFLSCRASQPQGETIEEAAEMAKEAIEAYLEVMHEDGLPIPTIHRSSVAVHAA